jgi:hypothetical protein
MQVYHTGLVTLNDDKTRLQSVRYFPSKFRRELGDTINYDGKKYTVGVIADDRNSVIRTLNDLIKKQNSVVRQENKIANAKFNAEFNKTLNHIFGQIKSDLNI